MIIIFGEMIRNTRESRVDIRTAEFFCRDIFACCRFDQWGPAKEDGTGVFYDDGLIAHGWHVCAARRA